MDDAPSSLRRDRKGITLSLNRAYTKQYAKDVEQLPGISGGSESPKPCEGKEIHVHIFRLSRGMISEMLLAISALYCLRARLCAHSVICAFR